MTEIKPIRDHKYKRVFIEASTEFSDDQKHTEFTMTIQGLYKKAQQVNGTVIINLKSSGTKEPVITKPNDIPLNHTDLGANVKVADNA